MRIVCKLAAVVAAVLALSLAACTTNTARPTGVVTGVAVACEAYSPTPPVRIPLMKVSLYSGSKLVASETVRSGSTYRFLVAPGAYQVKAAGPYLPQDVVVRAGRRVTATFMTYC
jgi:hypothetical protein